MGHRIATCPLAWFLLIPTLMRPLIATPQNHEFAGDILRELYPGDFGSEDDVAKRDTQNWRVPSSTDSIYSIGGNASTLDGAFVYKNGFSTSLWTAEYANFSRPFKFNVTMDLGHCNTSIRRTTDVGVYKFTNGTIVDHVTFIDLAEDIKTLINRDDGGNTTRVNDHIVTQGLGLLDDIDRGLAHVPRFCEIRNQSYLGQADSAAGSTGSVEILHDELRRRLQMLPQTNIEITEIESQPNTPGSVVSGAATPSGSVVAVTSNVAVHNILTGPTAQAYNLYLVVGVLGAGPVGGLGGLINELIWNSFKTNHPTWRTVTGGAISLILAFIYTALFLGRPLSAGSFNQAGQTSANVIQKSRDTLARPVNIARERGNRAVNGAGEGTMMAILLALIRAHTRDVDRRMSNLEVDARSRGFSGRPGWPVSFTGSFTGSIGQPGTFPLPNQGSGQNMATPGGPQNVNTNAQPGSTVNQGASSSGTQYNQPVCDLEDSATRAALGMWALRTGNYDEDARGLDELSQDELIRLIEAETRDRYGRCTDDSSDLEDLGD